jgi:hypothetical protein
MWAAPNPHAIREKSYSHEKFSVTYPHIGPFHMTVNTYVCFDILASSVSRHDSTELLPVGSAEGRVFKNMHRTAESPCYADCNIRENEPRVGMYVQTERNFAVFSNPVMSTSIRVCARQISFFLGKLFSRL